MKKIISMIIITVLVCSLCLCATSCKSTDGDKPEETFSLAGDIPGGVADVSAEVMEALRNSGDISVYSYASEKDGPSNYEKAFQTYFSEIYGGNLVYAHKQWEGWEQTFITEFSAGEGPDVIYLWYKLWPKAANQKMVYSVEDLTEKGVVALDHPAFEPDKELMQANFTYKRENYGIATDSASAVYIGVNTDLYKEHGVKSPVEYYNEGKWDIDTLIKCATEITKDLDNDGFEDTFGYNGWDLNWFVVANEGYLLEMDEDGKIFDNFDSINVINGLEKVYELYHTTKAGTQNASWHAGRIGMVGALKQNVGRFIVDNEVTFNWEVIPFPKGADNKNGTMPGDINGFAVSSASKNLQGAVNYILAQKVFRETQGDKYPDDDYACYTDKHYELFSDYDLKAKNAFFMGVGSLWGGQWPFWDQFYSNAGGVTEILESRKNIFLEQAALEMENAVED